MSALQSAPVRRAPGYEGRSLGGFRIVRELAAGGMATVYLGYKVQQAGVRQLAALKVIHPHLAGDQEFVDMFLDEARIASHVNHPNVCRVLDFGRSEGTYYLAMEYVLGETWADVLKRMCASRKAAPMIVPVLAQVLSQACEGLHAAHLAQDSYGNPLRIVHRDVSPYNIMVGYDGSVRVLDFGIASAADRLHTTRGGAVKGRLAYMAPEQMRGLTVDARADVWSLGVVLWEGLAQKRLFPGNNDARTVFAVTQEPVPSLAGTGHPIPFSLQQVAATALQRECSARYDSARAMGLALSRFRSEWSTPADPPAVSEWMQTLFERELADKRALLREGADSVSGPMPGIATEALSDTVSDGHDSEAPSSEVDAQPCAPVSGVRRVSPPATTRPLRVLAITAACLTLLLSLGFGVRKLAAKAKPTSSSAAQVTEGQVRATTTAVVPVASSATQDELDLVFSLSDVEASQGLVSERAAARPSRMGTVSIVTTGAWADVYVGARKLGTTPVRLSLPEGVHTLRLRTLGIGPDVSRRVVVTAAAASRLKVDLH